MQFEETITELRKLDFADRIARVDELLRAGGWTADERARIAYFKAHAQKQLGLPEDALGTCTEALTYDMPAERRALLLLCLGLCQYDIGHFAGLQATCDQLGSLPMTADIRGYWLMLRGRLLLRSREPVGFELFQEAESIFAQSDDEAGKVWAQAWAQLSIARLAILLGDLGMAKAAAGRVEYRPYIPKAQLIKAEVAAAEGRVDDAVDLVNQASTMNATGLEEADDRARAKYVLAKCMFLRGDYMHGAILMNEAGIIARSAQRVDLELVDAINALRAQATVHEVGR